ncbi:hypothetical protein BT96DRAFT_754965, partial [Gymnopus androsaceus JB14]
KPLAAKGHPEEVGAWVKAGRDHSFIPNIDDLVAFGVKLVAWWETLVPEPPQVEGPLSASQVERWKKIRVPGINGLYTVFICLRWW